ncbi:MAG: hypothetical protein WBZ36_26955 [Candidatus Nitrosopolaris sp.]
MITGNDTNGHHHEIDAGIRSCLSPHVGLVSLQQLSILGNSFNGGINSIGDFAFALVSGNQITQKLAYAHFLPLTNNNKLHQVKVIVDYAPVSVGQYAYMKVYGPNKALLKISSSPAWREHYCSGQSSICNHDIRQHDKTSFSICNVYRFI